MNLKELIQDAESELKSTFEKVLLYFDEAHVDRSSSWHPDGTSRPGCRNISGSNGKTWPRSDECTAPYLPYG